MNHTPTFCALNINLKNDHKSNDLTEQKKNILQQVQYQEYLQQMDMYQKDQQQNYVEDQLPKRQDLYLLLPNIKT